MNRSSILLAAAALLAATSVGVAENYGRVTAPNEVVSTEITPAQDVDDFVFEGAPGWQIKATVKKAKTGDLAPVLELIDPDGAVEATGKSSSKASAIKKAILAKEGRYAFRVRGASGTGGYSLAWSIKPDKGLKIKNETIALDAIRLYEFAAVDGALVSWTLKFKGDGGIQVERILDPEGVPVAFNESAVVRGATSEKAKDIPLSGPGGMYALEVRDEFGPVVASLTVKVKMPKLPKAAVTLSPTEPLLTGINMSTGGCQSTIILTGVNLGVSPGKVRFGSDDVAGVVVSGGTQATFTAPGGSGTVNVAFAANDGQVSVLANAFTYVPLHTVSGFSPTGGPGAGGQAMTVTGSNFRTGIPGLYQVLVGGTPASQVVVQNANTITCVTPAHVAGTFPVELRDSCGEKAFASQSYTYGVAPFISLISPDASPIFGGIQVTIAGANFSANDTVYVDGVLVTTTPYVFQSAVVGHIITSLPAHAIGTVSVEVRSPTNVSAIDPDGMAYYAFTDVTSTAVPGVVGAEDWGGNSAAVVDNNNDGEIDWIVVSHPNAIGTGHGTRILENNGSGVFSSATANRMPATTATEKFEANKVLARRRSNSSTPDLYLSRPGTGTEARTPTEDSFEVLPFGRILQVDGGNKYADTPTIGASSYFGIPGIPHCGQNTCWNGPKCFLFDYDFRSVGATVGDLDGDGDQDVVLVNDQSISRFKGTGNYAIYIGCSGSVPKWPGYTKYPYGSAMRVLSTGSNGGLTDQSKVVVEPTFTADEDFRAVDASIAHLHSDDSLIDIVITHNQSLPKPSSGNHAATRVFRQRNTGNSVVFSKVTGVIPNPATASDDDWRGDCVRGVDLNNDLRADLIIGLNDDPPGASILSTRILMRKADSAQFEDKTSTILGGVLPSGDTGRAKMVLPIDLDKDGDQDLILTTPDAVGTGNRRTRYLMNIGPDSATGLPRFQDASSLFPAAAVEPGNAVAVLAADIDGDGDLDLIMVDTHVGGGSGRRLRIFRQDR
jgi:hypothetical protein